MVPPSCLWYLQPQSYALGSEIEVVCSTIWSCNPLIYKQWQGAVDINKPQPSYGVPLKHRLKKVFYHIYNAMFYQQRPQGYYTYLIICLWQRHCLLLNRLPSFFLCYIRPCAMLVACFGCLFYQPIKLGQLIEVLIKKPCLTIEFYVFNYMSMEAPNKQFYGGVLGRLNFPQITEETPFLIFIIQISGSTSALFIEWHFNASI